MYLYIRLQRDPCVCAGGGERQVDRWKAAERRPSPSKPRARRRAYITYYIVRRPSHKTTGLPAAALLLRRRVEEFFARIRRCAIVVLAQGGIDRRRRRRGHREKHVVARVKLLWRRFTTTTTTTTATRGPCGLSQSTRASVPARTRRRVRLSAQTVFRLYNFDTSICSWWCHIVVRAVCFRRCRVIISYFDDSFLTRLVHNLGDNSPLLFCGD